MYVGFGLLAACASFDVLFYELSESWAFILFMYEFPGI